MSGGCIFCGADIVAELRLKQQMVHQPYIKAMYGDVADWAYPMHADLIVETALKKAARTIKQMDHDKAWCSSDVEEALRLLRAAVEAMNPQ